MNNGQRQSDNSKRGPLDRILSVIEGLASRSRYADEDREFIARRLADAEERLARLDGEHGANGASARAYDETIEARRAAGRPISSVGVGAGGRLEFPGSRAR